MIVIDSSALVAIARGEAEADRFLTIIADADVRLLSAVTLLETSLVLAGSTRDRSAWIEFDALIAAGSAHIVPFDAAQAELARSAFLRYGRGRHPAALNFGDCATYALAKSRDLPLLFKGNDFSKTDLVAAA